MVLLREFRVPLPLEVSEYERAQLYMVAEMSKEETKNSTDAGVEILKNEPFENEHGKGQYTHKIYHVGSRLPRFITAIVPSSALKLEEEAWNGYPYCKTVLTNPFLGERFKLTITSRHFADAGTQENVHSLDEKQLKQREVVYIDIANDKVEEKDYSEKTDPTKFHSELTGRGPFTGDWIKTTQPIMCCYKLVEMKFKVLGLESAVESFVGKFQRQLFLTFHRKLTCAMDQWYPLTMADIREMERKAKEELEETLAKRKLQTAGGKSHDKADGKGGQKEKA